jgi:hypothetical protein
MTKPTISAYLRDHLEDFSRKQEPGPYLTISRQFGCEGFELGQYLLEKFNERDPEGRWKMYYKELLRQLADDTGLTEEIIEQERFAKPSLFKDFLRGLGKSAIPDGYEIRNKITLMVRTVAYEGHAIIIGQGGASATADIHNGLSVRIEAPRDWRIEEKNPREPAFSLVFDNSIFKKEQIAELILRAMEQKGLIAPATA